MSKLEKAGIILLSSASVIILAVTVVEVPRIVKTNLSPLSSSPAELESDFSRELKRKKVPPIEIKDRQSDLDMAMAIELIVLVIWTGVINEAVAVGDYKFANGAILVFLVLSLCLILTPKLMLALIVI